VVATKQAHRLKAVFSRVDGVLYLIMELQAHQLTPWKDKDNTHEDCDKPEAALC
jgi:hypothetical protein